MAGGQGHRPVGQRGDAPGDGRLRPDPLAGLHGVAEEGRRAPDPTPARSGPVSHARRTWPRTSDSPSTAESSPAATVNRWLVTSSSNRTVRCSASDVDRAAADGGQKLLQLGHAVVEPLDHGVDLGAQAGGQDDRLGQVGLVPQPAQGLGQGALGHRHPLEQIERGVALLEADDDHRHRATASGRCRAHRVSHGVTTGSRASLGDDGPGARPPLKRRAGAPGSTLQPPEPQASPPGPGRRSSGPGRPGPVARRCSPASAAAHSDGLEVRPIERITGMRRGRRRRPSATGRSSSPAARC